MITLYKQEPFSARAEIKKVKVRFLVFIAHMTSHDLTFSSYLDLVHSRTSCFPERIRHIMLLLSYKVQSLCKIKELNTAEHYYLMLLLRLVLKVVLIQGKTNELIMHTCSGFILLVPIF